MSRYRSLRSAPGPGWQHHLPPAGACPQRAALDAVLRTPGSLTQAVRALSRDFAVRVVGEGFARPLPDEAPVLGTPARARVWSREVLLCDGGVPLVFAHTVLAREALVAWPWVRTLGRTPLGEVLFNHPRVVRLPLAFRRLDWRHPLYHAARRATGVTAARLWARRSLFGLDGQQLLVSEVFLPALLERSRLP